MIDWAVKRLGKAKKKCKKDASFEAIKSSNELAGFLRHWRGGFSLIFPLYICGLRPQRQVEPYGHHREKRAQLANGL